MYRPPTARAARRATPHRNRCARTARRAVSACAVGSRHIRHARHGRNTRYVKTFLSHCGERMTMPRWRGGHCDDTKTKAHKRVRAFLPTSPASFHLTTERSRSEASTQQRADNQHCNARLPHCPVCASSAPRPRSHKHARHRPPTQWRTRARCPAATTMPVAPWSLR